MYGMTEAGEVTSKEWGTKGIKIGSVGMATPNTSLKVSSNEPKTIHLCRKCYLSNKLLKFVLTDS